VVDGEVVGRAVDGEVVGRLVSLICTAGLGTAVGAPLTPSVTDVGG
jgi:hypothetical protein